MQAEGITNEDAMDKQAFTRLKGLCDTHTAVRGGVMFTIDENSKPGYFVLGVIMSTPTGGVAYATAEVGQDAATKVEPPKFAEFLDYVMENRSETPNPPVCAVLGARPSEEKNGQITKPGEGFDYEAAFKQLMDERRDSFYDDPRNSGLNPPRNPWEEETATAPPPTAAPEPLSIREQRLMLVGEINYEIEKGKWYHWWVIYPNKDGDVAVDLAKGTMGGEPMRSTIFINPGQTIDFVRNELLRVKANFESYAQSNSLVLMTDLPNRQERGSWPQFFGESL